MQCEMHFLLRVFCCVVQMGAEIGARAISHLEEVSSEGIKAMAKAGTVAVLLPTTAYMLRLNAPPARSMIEAGVTVALGSDFNPNAHCYAMVGSNVCRKYVSVIISYAVIYRLRTTLVHVCICLSIINSYKMYSKYELQ